jgi:hypothetical protein
MARVPCTFVRKSASIANGLVVRTFVDVATPALLIRSVTSGAAATAASICSGLVVSSTSASMRESANASVRAERAVA